MHIKELFKYFIAWRLVLVAVAVIASFLIPLRPDFTLQTDKFQISNLATMWANFDGPYYLKLAKHNYTQFSNGIYTFFPVYPKLISFFSSTNHELFAGLTLSHLSLFLALLVFYKLLRLDYSEKISRTSIFLLLLFPTSFLLGSVNSESLFLLLVVTTFYFIRKNNFLLAVLTAALASATRFTGVFLWPVLGLELWQANKHSLRKTLTDPRAVLLTIPPLGLLAFMRYQFFHVGDWFKFLSSQPNFISNRAVEKLILFHQIIFRYVKMLVVIPPFSDPIYFTLGLELLISLLLLVLVIVSFKKTRLSYAVFATMSFLVPTLTGTFTSIPRYALTIFPIFIILAQWFTQAGKKSKKIYVLVSVILSLVSIALYTRGYFVG